MISLLKKPSAWIPIAIPLAFFAYIVTIISFFGIVREEDEGTAAHLFQIWLVLELVRFGRPFGGYPGEDFSYPVLTGLLRLTLLPNKGLLVYAPVCILAVPGLLALRRRDPALALGLAASVAAVLATAASGARYLQGGRGTF